MPDTCSLYYMHDLRQLEIGQCQVHCSFVKGHRKTSLSSKQAAPRPDIKRREARSTLKYISHFVSTCFPAWQLAHGHAKVEEVVLLQYNNGVR
eukprot:m.252516 g.252516  ORF g.252516 m.252516 type:complete len:93 (-) comp17188_c0_seq1:1143-1421(-)